MLLFGDLFGQVTEEIPIGKSRSRRDRIDRANWNLSRYTSRSLESSSQTAAVFSCARLKENRKSWKAQEIYFDWLCFQITGYTDVDAPLILRYTKKKIIPTTTIKKQEKQINKERTNEKKNNWQLSHCEYILFLCWPQRDRRCRFIVWIVLHLLLQPAELLPLLPLLLLTPLPRLFSPNNIWCNCSVINGWR